MVDITSLLLCCIIEVVAVIVVAVIVVVVAAVVVMAALLAPLDYMVKEQCTSIRLDSIHSHLKTK